MALILRSNRWTYVGFEQISDEISQGTGRVYCCWHERLALSAFFRDWLPGQMTNLYSQHPDAQVAVRFVRSKNVNIIPVMTSGNKTAPFRTAVRELRRGVSVGLTPDGPFGPARSAQQGAILIAGLGRARLAPVAFSTSRRFRLKTWDSFVVPLPFGRGAFVLVDGFVPPQRLDDKQLASAQARLSELIDKATAEADRIVDQV